MNFKNTIIALSCAFLFFGCGGDDKKNGQTSSDAQIEANKTDANLSQNSAKSEPVVDLHLNLLNGKTINLQKRKDGFDIKDNDKATLFVFFATWCPPCRAEIPHLNNLSEKFKEELNIIGVLLEEKNEQEVKDFAKKYNIKYDVAVGEGNFLLEKAVGGIIGLPSSALYKPNGNYAIHYTGLVPEEMLENDILKAIK